MHDVALFDSAGQLLAERRCRRLQVPAGPARRVRRAEENPIPVANETSRSLLVNVLRTGERNVFAINPTAAARYRDRHSVSRKKSRPGDAMVLDLVQAQAPPVRVEGHPRG